nr:ATP synthase F0 subunit 8 [Asemonea sichuanensis]ULX45812.1 ATP synthase F0 subunit 8 [Asemonea sichuanensis]
MPQLMPLIWFMSVFMSSYIVFTLIDMFHNNNIKIFFHESKSKYYNMFMW